MYVVVVIAVVGLFDFAFFFVTKSGGSPVIGQTGGAWWGCSR